MAAQMKSIERIQSDCSLTDNIEPYISSETAKQVIDFRDERNWKQFHNPKDLAISISLEASELLEIFQWSGENTGIVGKENKVKEELADIFNYCILMADVCGLNADKIIREKIQCNAKKYPADKAYGNSKKYTEI